MLFLLDFPSIVKKYAPYFKDCFSPEGYEHFKKALSGFLISENKTLSAINELFVLSPRHVTSFYKFFNRQNFDLDEINQHRLEMLQSNKNTKFKNEGGLSSQGVLSVDNSLLKHYGKHFSDIYYHYDYVHKCYRWSHDLVTLYYSDNSTDYPVYHQLWKPPNWDAVATFLRNQNFTINQIKWDSRHKSRSEAQKWRNYIRSRYKAGCKKHPKVVEIYKTKNHIAETLIRKFCATYSNYDFPIALDNGYTSAHLCRIISEELHRNYVGSLRGEQHVEIDGKEQSLDNFLKNIKKIHHDPKSTDFQKKFKKIGFMYKGKKQTCYAYIGNHRIRHFEKKQRLVISFLDKSLKDRPSFTISNRTNWNESTILRIRRHRWPVETFHQEGKAEGLDKYQVRGEEAIQTYIALIITTFSMLKCATHDAELLYEFQQQFQTKFSHLNTKSFKNSFKAKQSNVSLPFIRKLMKLESLMKIMEYVLIQFEKGESLEQTFKSLTISLV